MTIIKWKDIKPGKVKKMTPNWTYVDMDGVIADFFGSLAKEFNVNHWKDIPTQEEVVERLTGSDFFGRISTFPSTKQFLVTVDKYTKGRWSILSTPLKGDEENSSKHKDRWLNHVFAVVFGHRFNKERFYSHNKWMWATDTGEISSGKPNLLIDDRPTNLEEFKAKGGLTIRYQANESKFEKFENKLKELFDSND